MCELFAVSASQPVDVGPFLARLMPRGGQVGPHADGWGVAYYEGCASRIFKDAAPAAESRLLAMLTEFKVKSTSVIAHIRKANPSIFGRATANTHPFEREWNGRSWVFAHNGKLPGLQRSENHSNSWFQPVGETDSELAFCLILNTIAKKLGPRKDCSPDELVDAIQPMINRLGEFGEFNFILGDGEHLYVHAHTNLHLLKRSVMEDNQLIMEMYMATSPLTEENWTAFEPNSLHVFKQGAYVIKRNIMDTVCYPVEYHDMVVNA